MYFLSNLKKKYKKFKKSKNCRKKLKNKKMMEAEDYEHDFEKDNESKKNHLIRYNYMKDFILSENKEKVDKNEKRHNIDLSLTLKEVGL